MKKIGLYLSVGPHAGGSYQYCLSVVNYFLNLNKKFYKTKIFITNNIWRKKIPKNIEVVKLKNKSFFERYLNYFSFFFLTNNFRKFFFNCFSANIRTLNKSDCDIIIFPSQEDISSKIKIKSITAIHDLMHRYEHKFKEYRFYERLKRDFFYKKICQNSSKIIVDSNIGKKHAIESYNVKSKNIIVSPFEIPNYLKKSKVIEIYKKYQLPKKKFIFYPAQFWEHKNHLNLIKAFNLIQKKIDNINLVLVGTEKNNLLKIRKKISNLNLSKKVFILGYVHERDMFSFYKKALMTSFVSFCGPTNIPPLESIFAGCPLLCSNVYGMKKQLGNGAIYVNPHSYKDIYKKMLIIIQNNNIRKKIIKNGFYQIKKKQNIKFLKNLDKELKNL